MCAPSALQIAVAGLSRRELFLLAAGATAGAVASGHARAVEAPKTLSYRNVADLTHVLSPTFPIWPGNAPIRITPKASVARDGYFANRWEVGEHHGTHLDSPAHFVEGGTTAERLPAASFIAPLAVLDIRERVKRDADATMTVDDLLAWEKRHGKLPAGAAVFLSSGWGDKAGDPAAFLGTDGGGALHFPGLAPEACAFLVKERDVVGVGVDTLSVDVGPSKDFKSHKELLKAGKWVLECVANVASVPPAGATVFVGGPKVAGASGGPTRALAVWG
jgi:kynurenine formamidase